MPVIKFQKLHVPTELDENEQLLTEDELHKYLGSTERTHPVHKSRDGYISVRLGREAGEPFGRDCFVSAQLTKGGVAFDTTSMDIPSYSKLAGELYADLKNCGLPIESSPTVTAEGFRFLYFDESRPEPETLKQELETETLEETPEAPRTEYVLHGFSIGNREYTVKVKDEWIDFLLSVQSENVSESPGIPDGQTIENHLRSDAQSVCNRLSIEKDIPPFDSNSE